ncbi:hypothetical protein O181_014143 [Austropuccinia psidii MF-1]|uniref:DUF4939 domain-containing protein n=1 Tax=Austropuccinia psidii MF-1 TaxID=1389203 RepID=A0A9Q3GNS1_9BASI|nr:hypothetical protein [Austropuccinia psidii MF-1]
MPIQQSPPARKKRSQAITQAVLTPSPKAPLDGAPAVPQMRVKYGRKEEGQEDQIPSQEWLAVFQDFQGPFSKFLVKMSKTSLLDIMQQMTKVMANLQAASSPKSSRPPAFNTPSMREPECFDKTQPFKVRRFIQYCQLILHNDLANFSQDRKKVLYVTAFLICRAEKWIEPHFSNITNQDPSYLLNSWNLF